ncbi:MAG: hypothetical protein LBC10_00820, partial [Deltaproteobacteria bacterium]|nr:hypothetical protein [Deltaproteobacteria bacterium]
NQWLGQPSFRQASSRRPTKVLRFFSCLCPSFLVFPEHVFGLPDIPVQYPHGTYFHAADLFVTHLQNYGKCFGKKIFTKKNLGRFLDSLRNILITLDYFFQFPGKASFSGEGGQNFFSECFRS